MLFVVGSTLYVDGTDGVSGAELWKTDGTPSGTTLVKDINPGPANSFFTNAPSSKLAAIGSTFYFTADNGTNGRELWKTDGTGAGTVMVKDINPGPTGSNPVFLVAAGSTLYFLASDGTNGTNLSVWKSDGTAAGTVRVKDFNLPFGAPGIDLRPAVLGSAAYFIACETATGCELWTNDKAGTVLVKDINPGTGSSFPDALRVVGSTLYFSASVGASSNALWKSDGTPGGTVMLKDTNPTLAPREFAAIGTNVFFESCEAATGCELWKTDGTAAGTALVKDINPGNADASPLRLTVVGSMLYFFATDGVNGFELWKSDGTEGGTVMVKDINPAGDGAGGPSLILRAFGEGAQFVSLTFLQCLEDFTRLLNQCIHPRVYLFPFFFVLHSLHNQSWGKRGRSSLPPLHRF